MTASVKSAAVLCLVAILNFISCSRSPSKAPAPATTSRFHAGQVWSFHTPTNQLAGATLTIVNVEFDRGLGPVIYTSVSRVRRPTWMTHEFMSFSQDALDRSVITLLRQDVQLSKEELETFQEVYSRHLQGIESGELKKCFTITVAEVIEAQRKQELEEQKIAERKNNWPWWRFWQ